MSFARNRKWCGSRKKLVRLVVMALIHFATLGFAIRAVDQGAILGETAQAEGAQDDG